MALVTQENRDDAGALPGRDVVSFPARAITLHPMRVFCQDVLSRKSWADGEAGRLILGANAV